MSDVEVLILIGYWRSDEAPHWPNPEEWVDTSWEGDERDVVLDHLSAGFVARSFMGFSPCRICGQPNGALELTDGVFAWPDGLGHYVDQHRVRLPGRFVDHVVALADRRDSAVYDSRWWRSLGVASTPGTSEAG